MNDVFPLPHQHVRLKRCRYGPMLYLTNDIYIGRSLDVYGEWSDGEMQLLRQLVRPGQFVLDVGANMGTHTVFLAQTVGPRGVVLAFEPQRVIFQILCANVSLNGLANVHARPAAVGRRPGEINVPQLDVMAEQNFGSLSLTQDFGGEKVEMVSIDSLNVPACHLIKGDVEGMEMDVVVGAIETIKRFRPLLYLETEEVQPSTELVNLLLELGYRMYQHVVPLFTRDNFFRHDEDVFDNTGSYNLLGIHRSLAQTIEGLPEITPRNHATPKE